MRRITEAEYRDRGLALNLDLLDYAGSVLKKSKWRCRRCGRIKNASYRHLSRCICYRRSTTQPEDYHRLAEWLGPLPLSRNHPTYWKEYGYASYNEVLKWISKN